MGWLRDAARTPRFYLQRDFIFYLPELAFTTKKSQLEGTKQSNMKSIELTSKECFVSHLCHKIVSCRVKIPKLDVCLDFDRCTRDPWTHCVFIWTQFLFNTTFCWSATILTLVNNLYRISVNTLWITIKPAGRSDRISKSNLQNLYSWTVRQFKMLIFHHRRYVLNLNNTDILPLRLFVPIIAEISNCQTKPIFILWNKCLLTCFLGDIFWQIWSRNLFTPCWPLIFYAPPLPPHCPRVHLHTLQFFRSSCFLFA